MSKKINLIGKKFGKLKVLSEAGIKNGHLMLESICDCGETTVSRSQHLRDGKISHCGCVQHLPAGGQSKYPEYKNWKAMIYRCNNPDRSHFYAYGGRGIKVCERWMNSFWDFLIDVGKKPTVEHSLDRIDVNGNYEPGNVRWATPIQQAQNKRPSPKRINFNDYQKNASVTAKYPQMGDFGGFMYCALGVAGEAGEMVNHVQKLMRDNQSEISSEFKEKIMKEMGDILWFMSQMCKEMDVDFSHVPTMNLEKLYDRMKRNKISGYGDNR